MVINNGGGESICIVIVMVEDNIVLMIICFGMQMQFVDVFCQVSFVDYISFVIVGDNCGIVFVV